jgi:hypothetical protein
MARPRGQRGQVKLHGANWLFVYYLAGKRTHVTLAPYTLYPFRDDEKGREQVREQFTDKISELLRPANADVPSAPLLDGLLTAWSSLSHNVTGSDANNASNLRVRTT